MSKDIQVIWNKLASERLNKPIGGKIFLPSSSSHPLEKLKSGYLIAITLSLVFLTAFIVLIFLFQEMIVRLSLVCVIFSYVFFLITNFSLYAKIKTKLPVDQSLLATLSHTVDLVTANIRFQERAALLVYPVMATSGFLMGGSAGGDVVSMMQKEGMIFILLGVVIILTPLCYLLSHWMFKVSYGKWLRELKDVLAELQQ